MGLAVRVTVGAGVAVAPQSPSSMDRSNIFTMLSLLKSSGWPLPLCCQWPRKIDRSKILTVPSPLRSPTGLVVAWEFINNNVPTIATVSTIKTAVVCWNLLVWLEKYCLSMSVFTYNNNKCWSRD